jgi:uncharacterized protein YjiS (DUF1127 family)
MTTSVAMNRPAVGAARLSPARSPLSNLGELLADYAQLRRERRELLSLDDRMLKDIGLSRADAERIAAEPFRWLSRRSR